MEKGDTSTRTCAVEFRRELREGLGAGDWFCMAGRGCKKRAPSEGALAGRVVGQNRPAGARRRRQHPRVEPSGNSWRAVRRPQDRCLQTVLRRCWPGPSANEHGPARSCDGLAPDSAHGCARTEPRRSSIRERRSRGLRTQGARGIPRVGGTEIKSQLVRSPRSGVLYRSCHAQVLRELCDFETCRHFSDANGLTALD